MKTEQKLKDYNIALRVWKLRVARWTECPGFKIKPVEPLPEHFQLFTALEVWSAGKLRDRAVGSTQA